MKHAIGIRREDKNRWEWRVPVTPEDVRDLSTRHSLEFVVQPSPIRVFDDDAYRAAGAVVEESLDDCPVVFSVKEIPVEFLKPGRTYIYFSHTIKGQPKNMGMLKRLMELKCQLVDYETIVDDAGRRLVFFGRHAGLAGMIDTLWTLGRRLEWEGISPNPFSAVKQAFEYRDLDDVRERLGALAEAIRKGGLPRALCPMVFGFAGYGNVSLGAQEILDLLPVEEVDPDEVPGLIDKAPAAADRLFKTVYHERHLAVPRDEGRPFVLQDYYDNPERYAPAFSARLPHLTVLMNCIYWTPKYPKLITKDEIAALFAAPGPRLRVVGDISCDVEGAVEFLLKNTDSGNPVFVYEPATGRAVDGVAGKGPVLLGVDNLPCELGVESSEHFSRSLKPFIDAIASADYTVSFEELELPAPIKKGMILHRGELTPDYEFMERFIT